MSSSGQDARLDRGSLVGSYRLLERLAAGGPVEVWKAHHSLIDRYVAVELVRLDRPAAAGFAERFQRDVRVLSRLNHPGILAINSFGTQEELAYLTRPYATGLTLDHLLGGPWPLAEALLVLEPLGSALDYVHARGLVHGGIRAASVLVTDDARVLLLGFGIGWLLDGAGRGSADGGRGSADGDGSALAADPRPPSADLDVEGFGRIAFELLVGRPPFDREVWPAELQPRPVTPLAPPCALSASLPAAVVEALFRSMMAAEPERRLASAGALVRAIRSTLPGSTVDDQAELAAGRMSRPMAAAARPPSATPSPSVLGPLTLGPLALGPLVVGPLTIGPIPLDRRRARRVAAGLGSAGVLAALAFLLLVQPALALLGGRGEHAAVLLASGEVLVAGGCGNAPAEGSVAALLRLSRLVGARAPQPGWLASTLLFAPGEARWAAGGRLSRARCDSRALALPDGKVLVVGGSTGEPQPTGAAERYDRTSNTWLPAGQLWIARRDFAAVALSSGQVMVLGGQAAGDAPLASTERYDPPANRWSVAASMAEGRRSPTATLLDDGRVLVVGGIGAHDATLPGVERWDPAANAWSRVAGLQQARTGHTATLLANGQVLVVGGAAGRTTLASAERYDPAADAWQRAAPLGQARANHTATLLPDGDVLVVGGLGPTGELSSVERFNTASGAWRPVARLARARSGHSATLLADGRVLVVGGRRGPGEAPYLNSAEVYDPLADRWSGVADLPF